MFTPTDVRRVFPGNAFGLRVVAETFAAAERELGHALPSQLIDLYLEFNGFLGPTGAPFLFPLFDRSGTRGETLVSYTKFFRSEGYFPEWVQRAVVVGDNGTGAAWFMLLDEECKVVVWDAEWEDYESIEGSLLDAWVKEKEFYDSLAGPDA